MIFHTDIHPAGGTPPDDWPQFSWFAVWDQMVGAPCDLAVGGEVILVDRSGMATWRTEVTDLALVPFEHIEAGLGELRRRWKIEPEWSGPAVSPGMLVAWRAHPLSYLGAAVPMSEIESPLQCGVCAGAAVDEWLRALPPAR